MRGGPRPACRLRAGQSMRPGMFVAGLVAVALSVHSQNALPEGPPSAFPASLCVQGNTLFFSADDGIHGRELWRCDASGHCRMAAEIVPGAQGGVLGERPDLIYAVGSWVYFFGNTPNDGRELWAFDPASETIRSITQDVYPGPMSSSPDNVHVHDGCDRIYFVASSHAYGQETWCSIASEDGYKARLLIDVVPGSGSPSDLVVFPVSDGTALLAASGVLMRSDGTPSGTKPIFQRRFAKMAEFRDTTLLAAQGDGGGELWRTDGTEAGTRFIGRIGSSRNNAITGFLADLNGLMLFAADDGVHGVELWRTDGTMEGTQLVKDINPGLGDSNPYNCAISGGVAYFLAENSQYGKELWRTNGAPEGTMLVSDLFPGPTGSGGYWLTPFHNQLFFGAVTPQTGEELFVTDGTPEGTRVLLDIMPGKDSSGPGHPTVFMDRIYFSARNPEHGEELWSTDGTPGGTAMVADINKPLFNPSSNPRQLTALGERLLFTTRSVDEGEELWISDGTADGTHALLDIAPGTANSSPRQLTPSLERAFFTAEDGRSGRELWVTEGSPETTRMVADIFPGHRGSAPDRLCAHDGRVFFVADDGVHGREVWVSDGLSGNTAMVVDGTPGTESSDILRICSFEGSVFFYAGTGGAVALWRSDGRSEGTVLLTKTVFPLILDCPEGETIQPAKAATSDAEAANDTLTLFVQILAPPQWPVDPRSRYVAFQNALYGTAYVSGYGAELCRFEPDTGRITLLCDLFPGAGSSNPEHLCVMADTLYFTAEVPSAGRIVWRSDGTRPGTHQVTSSPAERWTLHATELLPLNGTLLLAGGGALESHITESELGFYVETTPDGASGFIRSHIGPPRKGIWPGQLTRAGALAFFTADDGRHGRELWKTDGSLPGTLMVKDLLPPGNLLPFAERNHS